MFDRLSVLKQKGYYPDMILDIGAYHGTWTVEMKKIYPGSTYHLFEAIDYQELKVMNNVHNVLLNDNAREVDWYQMKNTGDSMFKETTYHFANCPAIKRSSIDLDTYCKQNNIAQSARNIFIKIDCQGAEIPILKGALRILEKTDFVVMEIPLFGKYNEGVQNFLEHISFMDNIGFTPYDIVDNHYINGFNVQVDFLFINKKHEFNDNVNHSLLH
jgi:hypothetical protein